jgi:hypothetical protein
MQGAFFDARECKSDLPNHVKVYGLVRRQERALYSPNENKMSDR